MGKREWRKKENIWIPIISGCIPAKDIPVIQSIDTLTVARVIALLQQDMRAALSDTPLAELRAKYREEYLFSPEESAKISHFG